MSTDTSIYDKVPFPSLPFPNAHPERLATVAQLAGLAPPSLQECRVLELGCGAGGNVVAIADSLPQSQCLGIDLSPSQIELGLQLIQSLGLSNIRLSCSDLLEFDESLGLFDFIICHGVYSWSPAPVRDKILSICQHHLTDNGLAYVNFNTHPGWHIQAIIRDALQFHAGPGHTPPERIRRARELIDNLAVPRPHDKSPFGALLALEFSNLQKGSDAYLYHAYLNMVNFPLYFREFIAHCERYRLTYVGDAEIELEHSVELNHELNATWRKLEPDWLRRQDLLDVMHRRMSRNAIVCRAPQELRRDWHADLEPFWFAANLTPSDPDSSTVSFRSPDGQSITTQNEELAATLMKVREAWPASVLLRSIIAEIRSKKQHVDLSLMKSDLWNCVSAGLVDISVIPARPVGVYGDRPKTGRLARHQAIRELFVTDLRHHPTRADSHEREVLMRLDGMRTVDELQQELGPRGIDVRVVLDRLAQRSLLS